MQKIKINGGIVDHSLPSQNKYYLASIFCVLLGSYPSAEVLMVKFNLTEYAARKVISDLRSTHKLKLNKELSKEMMDSLKENK